MDLSQAKYVRTRNIVAVHGMEYTVKKQRGRYYIHAENSQVTVTDIVNKPDEWDLFSWYVLSDLVHKFPCRVMNWWVDMRLKGRYIKAPVETGAANQN